MSLISLKVCEIKEKVDSGSGQLWTVALLDFKSDQLARNCVVVCPNNKLWTSNFSSNSLLHVYNSEKYDCIHKYIFGTVSHEKSYEIDVSEDPQRHLVTKIISKFVGTKERTIELLNVLTQGTLDFEPYKSLEIPTTTHERKVKNWGAWS
ncbi:hypothetical protein ACN1NW_000479 [Acinetobacter baumannii]|nr:hypothetical protein [Acinetobacter baumannii]ELA7031061.1 hypothetical protein [Acinetobacter baumannii]ELA7118824.1 hypothetical protein [Acinetobacter baumannii]ELB0919774.1 hypothetical protein [Acinetobacter baumannii]ELB0965951.1 hypothetical protein [Acinetobacter baumannii]